MDRSSIDILFGQKIDLFNDMLFEFNVGKSTRCAVTHPSVAFFNQASAGSSANLHSALLAFPLYKINKQSAEKKNKMIIISSGVFTFLIALPIACYEPIYIIRLFNIHHIGLRKRKTPYVCSL